MSQVSWERVVLGWEAQLEAGIRDNGFGILWRAAIVCKC
jgi:hypothetical protein